MTDNVKLTFFYTLAVLPFQSWICCITPGAFRFSIWIATVVMIANAVKRVPKLCKHCRSILRIKFDFDDFCQKNIMLELISTYWWGDWLAHFWHFRPDFVWLISPLYDDFMLPSLLVSHVDCVSKKMIKFSACSTKMIIYFSGPITLKYPW